MSQFINGRSSRLAFAGAIVGIIVACVLAGMFCPFLPIEVGGTIAILLIYVIAPGGFILFSIRRLNDMNISRWWAVFGFVPYANMLFVFLLMVWPPAEDASSFDTDSRESNGECPGQS